MDRLGVEPGGVGELAERARGAGPGALVRAGVEVAQREQAAQVEPRLGAAFEHVDRLDRCPVGRRQRGGVLERGDGELGEVDGDQDRAVGAGAVLGRLRHHQHRHRRAADDLGRGAPRDHARQPALGVRPDHHHVRPERGRRPDDGVGRRLPVDDVDGRAQQVERPLGAQRRVDGDREAVRVGAVEGAARRRLHRRAVDRVDVDEVEGRVHALGEVGGEDGGDLGVALEVERAEDGLERGHGGAGQGWNSYAPRGRGPAGPPAPRP